MKNLKKLSLYIPVMVMTLSVVAIPVYAHDGEHEAIKPAATTEPSDDNISSTDSSGRRSGRDRTKAEDDAIHQENEDRMKARGAELLTAAKSEHKAKSKEQLEKICNTRKHGMETRTAKITANAVKHQARINALYAKIVAYKQDKNLTVADYDTLVAAADAAQIKSQDSVNALKALEPTIDCTATDVAGQVATFKAAAEQARTDLNAYKKAARAVFTAIKAAQTPATTEGDQ